MSLPLLMVIFFAVCIIALAFALIVGKSVVVSKEYVRNETSADTALYAFLNDNTCTGTKFTNAEIISFGLAQEVSADEDIEIIYNTLEETTTVETCLMSYFNAIDFTYETALGRNKYYLKVEKDNTIKMNLGSFGLTTNKETAQIATHDNSIAKITLFMEY